MWGAVSALFGFVAMVAIPTGVWSEVLAPGSEKLFRTFVINRRWEGGLARFYVKVPEHSEYFRASPSFPKSSTWRFFQTVSIVLFTASYSTIILRSLSLLRPQDEPQEFFLIAFATLTIGVPLIVGILWVYEDAGVRRIDPKSDTVSKVGTPLEQVFVGFGFAGTFTRFVYSLQTDPATAWATGLALVLILLPLCAFVAVFFHTEYYANVIEKFLKSEVASQLPRKNIVLEEHRGS